MTRCNTRTITNPVYKHKL